jgi:hypothetical protein
LKPGDKLEVVAFYAGSSIRHLPHVAPIEPRRGCRVKLNVIATCLPANVDQAPPGESLPGNVSNALRCQRIAALLRTSAATCPPHLYFQPNLPHIDSNTSQTSLGSERRRVNSIHQHACDFAMEVSLPVCCHLSLFSFHFSFLSRAVLDSTAGSEA